MTKQSQVKLLLACLLLSNLMLCGCSSSPSKIDSKNRTEEDNYVKFIFLSVLYTNLNGKTPDSVESIKEFYSDTNLPWCDLDWSKVECQKLDNGKVRMIYKPDKNSSLTIDINEPSLSPEDANLLKKALEELRKEHAK